MSDKEADFDKFSTLFSPATPRASPTLTTITLPGHEPTGAAGNVKHSSGGSHARRTMSSGSADDFGAFVSVSASEDPLALFDPLDTSHLSDSNVVRGGTSTNTAVTTSSSSAKRISASLNFFDKFAQDARLASERNKKDVLDELLRHEDDPLYWLKDPGPSTQVPSSSSNPQDAAQPLNESEFGEMVQATEASLIDLGFDDDEALPQSSRTESRSTSKSKSRSPTRHPSRTANASYPRMVTRKRSSSLAPPIASTSSVASTPTSSSAAAESDSDTSQPGSHSRHARSPSYQTLSSLSSKWMSSFMSSSRQTAPTNTLESLFASSKPTTPSRTRQSSASPSRRQTHAPLQVPHHAASLPTGMSSSVPEVQISHGTPFAPPVQSSHSPFAPHVYVPPTGAPGYGGERYDWDKGFSEELQHELALASDPTLIDGKGKTNESPSVSVLMEKKGGGIELMGRWESTTEVLESNLADLIRPHLPALSRLSRKWTLLYSLDQHGISLNTLYDRCERLGQAKSPGGVMHNRGALVVMKDSGDAVFGIWVGDGIRMSKGRGYYGSGESFLWRYAGENLEVFKWTGKNEYVTLCEPEYISFGGGDGHYGLYLDDTLLEGSSARCPTFDNDPLCSPGPRKAGAVSFECITRYKDDEWTALALQQISLSQALFCQSTPPSLRKMKVAFFLACVVAFVAAAPVEDYAPPKNYKPGFGQIGYQYGHTSSALKKAAFAQAKANKPSKASKAAPAPAPAAEEAAPAAEEAPPAEGA